MKLWLSRSTEIPIQEQLSTQLILGIVSADLLPGERLPSTTQLARRFQIHPNTVRAAYRELTSRRWLEWRQGSGFYVRAPDHEAKLNPAFDLDQLTATFLKVARERGYSLGQIQSGIERWLSVQAPDHVLVIEPDAELREILMTEIKDHVDIRVEGMGLCAETAHSGFPDQVGAICVALYDHAEEVRRVLRRETPFLFLRSFSIPKRLAGERRPSSDDIITVASRWPDFLHWARTTLVAIGIDPTALDLRDARRKGWDRGLTASSFIITDSLLARSVPKDCRPRVFQIISDESIAMLNSELAATLAMDCMDDGDGHD
jgi:GntR family transcriptional regulator